MEAGISLVMKPDFKGFSSPLEVERTYFMNRSCLVLISLFLYLGCLINASVTCTFIFSHPCRITRKGGGDTSSSS